MLRAVLDANVYISALLQPSGPPGRVIGRFLRDASFEVVVSPAIVEEVLRAFAYPKLRRFLRGVDAQAWFEDLVVLADMVPDAREIEPVCSDPDDDKYLAAAREGRATHVVTGDRAFLALQAHEAVEIVTPRAFIELLGS